MQSPKKTRHGDFAPNTIASCNAWSNYGKQQNLCIFASLAAKNTRLLSGSTSSRNKSQAQEQPANYMFICYYHIIKAAKKQPFFHNFSRIRNFLPFYHLIYKISGKFAKFSLSAYRFRPVFWLKNVSYETLPANTMFHVKHCVCSQYMRIQHCAATQNISAL